KIDAWVKSRDVGFYKITYILKRGTNPKEFNPDFFIKVGDNIAVIETKMNNDLCRENYSKMIDSKKHFSLLNTELYKKGINTRYSFNILSPSSYPDFENKLMDGSYFKGFNSEIEIQLQETFKNKND
ncbi:MAG TPA: restriction endonuclease subunit R, partial [Eubacteriales bacterium]|nr:restriction endonuclease subunit R [Eubacteriales bacterium]